MQNLVIRRANKDDLKAVQLLNQGLFDYESDMDFDAYIEKWALGKDAEEYFSDLIENEYVIVAEIDNEIIGYLAGSIYKDATFSYYEGLTAEIDNMFIKENYRKFGLGKKFINSFIKYCKSQNVKRVFVTASIKYENAICFYKNCGFDDINLTLKKEL